MVRLNYYNHFYINCPIFFDVAIFSNQFLIFTLYKLASTINQGRFK